MTQQYIGTKIITAWEQEKDGKPGYAVKYADGYTSWSPKDVFEAAYIAIGHIDGLPPHQQRLLGERAELADRMRKLAAFQDTPMFSQLDSAEQARLSRQYDSMSRYLSILGERIAALNL